MCGRYTLRSSPTAIAQEFGLFDVPDLSPRLNIAPSADRGRRAGEARNRPGNLRFS